jgi:hypothetical protein
MNVGWNAAMPQGISGVAARPRPCAAAKQMPHGHLLVDVITGFYGTRVSNGTERSLGRGGGVG